MVSPLINQVTDLMQRIKDNNCSRSSASDDNCSSSSALDGLPSLSKIKRRMYKNAEIERIHHYRKQQRDEKKKIIEAEAEARIKDQESIQENEKSYQKIKKRIAEKTEDVKKTKKERLNIDPIENFTAPLLQFFEINIANSTVTCPEGKVCCESRPAGSAKKSHPDDQCSLYGCPKILSKLNSAHCTDV